LTPKAFGRGPVRWAGAVLSVWLLACLPAAAQPQSGDASDRQDQQQPGDTGQEMFNTSYKVSITGVGNGLKTQLEGASRLVALKDYPPITVTALRSRAQSDVDNLMAALRSEGYYGADIRVTVDDSARPIAIDFDVSPGMQYRLTEITIAFTREGTGLPTAVATYGILTGGPARAADVLAAEATVLRQLGQQGYPFADVADRKVVVNHETRNMVVDLRIDPGPLTRFDGIDITGARTVEESFIRRYKLWESGDIYDQRLVDEMRTDLVDSGLFSIVTAKPERPAEDGGTGTIDLKVTESDQHTIGAGANYSSTEGFGVEGSWEHRNFFGRGERLTLGAEVAEIAQGLSAQLYKPQFLRRGQGLTLSAALSHENNDAYEELAVRSGIALDRELSEHWDGSVGTTLELSEIKDNLQGKRTFLLFGFPVGLRYDGTNSRLDPTRGARLRIQSTPYIATIGETTAFVRNEINASTYWEAMDAPRLVLAARARVGSILGSSRAAIPASKLFYSGGGGSVRGVDYQEAGQLDADGDPIGGRSVAEVSFEARLKVTETIGVVPFIDGGSTFPDNIPTFSHFYWGAGLGFRYHTPVGPVRLDLAVPLNPQPAYRGFQFYISLGQAF